MSIYHFRNEKRQPTFGEQFTSGLLQGQDRSQERKKMEFESGLRQKELTEKNRMEELSLPDYETVKSQFGETFAKLYKIAPTGGKTELLRTGLDSLLRGQNVNDLLGGIESPEDVNESQIPIKQDGKFEFPKLKPPSNLTPAGREKHETEIRKANSPIYKENSNKARATKGIEQRLDILEKLNEKLPEGLARLAINSDGNISPIALKAKLVPPEFERYAKTVNDFLDTAKDTFGSRVTNYDIQVFKARLPGLLNSKEGRKQITQQMKILNKIESNYRNSLKKIYNHYGLGKISEEQAEEMAERMTADEEEILRAQLDLIGNEEKSQSNQESGRPSLQEIFG